MTPDEASSYDLWNGFFFTPCSRTGGWQLPPRVPPEGLTLINTATSAYVVGYDALCFQYLLVNSSLYILILSSFYIPKASVISINLLLAVLLDFGFTSWT